MTEDKKVALRARRRELYKANPKRKENARLYYHQNAEKIKQQRHERHLKNLEESREKGRQYYADHADTIRLKKREYYKKNAKKINDKSKEWRKNNVEAVKKNHKIYREKNKEAVKAAHRLWYEGNKEAQKEYKKQYYIENKKDISAERKNYRNTYKGWLGSVKHRGRVTDLTEDQYYCLKNSPCSYCGAHENIIIDRIDSNGQYTIDNVTPSCLFCNILKWNHNVKDFIEQCYRIVLHCVFSAAK